MVEMLHGVMVVEEGLLVAVLLALRAVACGNVLSLALESNLQSKLLILPCMGRI